MQVPYIFYVLVSPNILIQCTSYFGVTITLDRPIFFIKNICADDLWAGRLTANIWQTSRPHIMNNHYTQSNLLIKNLLLSAHTNNYLIKLIFPLYKTGLLPRPANFPVIIFPKIDVHDSVVTFHKQISLAQALLKSFAIGYIFKPLLLKYIQPQINFPVISHP